MNAITLIWRQVLKELKLFQMKENKEDAVEKTEEEQLKTPESEGHEHIYTAPLPDTAPPTGKNINFYVSEKVGFLSSFSLFFIVSLTKSY